MLMISLSSQCMFIGEPQRMFTGGPIVHLTVRSIQMVACVLESTPSLRFKSGVGCV